MNETEWFSGRQLDEQLDRCYWRRVGFAIFLGVALALLMAPLYAEEVYRGVDDQGGAASLRLHEKPCTSEKVLEHLREQILDDRRFKAATLFYGGRDWQSCWIDIRETVMSIDEDGAPFQPIPRAKFQDEAL